LTASDRLLIGPRELRERIKVIFNRIIDYVEQVIHKSVTKF